MVTKNTWNKGMNSDISKLKTSNETYLDALNVSIITEEGNSSFSVQSLKGTRNSFRLPSPGPTYRLDFSGVTGNVTITITTSLIPSIIINIVNIQRLTNKEIQEQINTVIEGVFIGPPSVIAYSNNNYIVLYDYDTIITNITLTQGVSSKWTYTGGNYILGWETVSNELILITGDANIVQPDPENYNDPTILRNGTVGCIWKIPIDLATGQAINPDGSLVPSGGPLLPQNFLFYKELLNLSRFYNIYKNVKCRKESVNILRVIFSDFYNDIKTVNVLEENVQALPLGLVNILPKNELQQPIVTKIINGGFLPTGVYQIWYRLSSLQGSQSSISPLSPPIVIGSQDTIEEYSGAVVGSISTKSIEITINNLDTNYDLVRLGYIIYQVEGLAESFYFDELPIPASGSLTTVLNGNENDIAIEDQTLLSNVNRPPSIAKSLAVVKNKLTAANLKNKRFDVDFDARAYRFNAAQFAYLYNEGDTYGSPSIIINDLLQVSINGSPFTFTLADIPEDYDLINPYNDENPTNPLNNSNWVVNSQYKFQGDGTTLGGTGLNISYKFTFKDTIEDTNINTDKLSSPFINPVYSNNESFDFGNYQQPIPDSFKTMRSPYYDSLFRGYARGETYRHGIVFWDLYGYPSFVKWIGDIKIPFTFDGDIDPNVQLSITSSTNELICNQIGIEFTLDTNSAQFQAIKDKISGWSFVRVHRRTEDKTKLGIGLLENVGFSPVFGIGAAFMNVPNMQGSGSPGSGPGPLNNAIKTLHIPSFQKSIDNEFVNGDYIMLLGAYTEKAESNITAPSGGVINNSLYRNYDTNEDLGITTNYNTNTVLFKWSVEHSKSANFILADVPNGLPFPFVNMTTTDLLATLTDAEFDFMGNKLDLVTLTNNVTAFTNNDKRIVSYCRYVNSQYGGNTYVARTNNEYISTGHFQPYVENQSISPSKVFGGDVVTLHHSYQCLEKNFDVITGFKMPGNDFSFSKRIALFYPAEAHGHNPFYNIYSEPYSENQRSSSRINDSNIYEEEIPVNTAYFQPNNTSVFVSKPLVFNDIQESPYDIISTVDKIDGELVDTWRNFSTNNFITVNGNFGPINSLLEFKDKLFFYQENAIGIAAIDERVLINEGDTSQTQLGTGGILSRYDYISTETGIIHQFAVEKSGNSIYHYDALLNKFFRFVDGMRPESDVKGQRGRFNMFDPTIKNGDKLFLQPGVRKGVHIGYDSRNNRVYLTLLGEQESLTISYNELINNGEGGFESRWSFTPQMYLNTRAFFLSSDDSNTSIQLHNAGNYNEFYGVYKESYIKFRNNLDTPDLVKVFDNLLINTEVVENNQQVDETVTQIRFTNDYQDSGTLNTSNVIKKHLRSYRWNSIRNQSDKRRMYDKYIDVELTYNAPGVNKNKKFILHDVILENSQRSTIKPK
jgi:hypothetical protein